MKSSKRGEREKRVKAGGGQTVSGRRRRLPLLIVTAILLAAAAGLLLARPFWPSQRGHLGEELAAVGPTREFSFEGPAFSPQATVEDLRQEALRTTEELVAACPDAADALTVAARLQFSLGSSEQAAQMWRRCLELDPEFAGAYFGLGLSAKNRGDFEESAAMFQQVMILAPEDPSATPLLAEALMKSGQVARVVEVLESYMRTRVPTAETVVHLGQAYLQLEEYEKAKETFAALAETGSTAQEIYYGLSRACARLGQMEEARRHLEKFQTLDSAEEEVYLREVWEYEDVANFQSLLMQALVESGQVHRAHGNPAQAEELLRRAVFLKETDAQCRRELFSLYQEQGRDQDALWICEQLCEIERENPAHWFNAGLLNGRLQRYAAAQSAIRQAIQLAPDNPTYRQAYELVKQGT